MRSITRFITLAVLLCAPLLCSADEDEAKDCDGCKDHPMLARYPGSFLFGADMKTFEEAALPIGPVTQNGAGEPVAPVKRSRHGCIGPDRKQRQRRRAREKPARGIGQTMTDAVRDLADSRRRLAGRDCGL